MSFYDLLESALRSDDVGYKAKSVEELLEYCSTAKALCAEDFTPRSFELPSYHQRCRIVPPRELPRRRGFRNAEGLAYQLHAIAHIEYSAIDLALDAVYRFPKMPIEYKRDWLEVASDEARHFSMLESLLEELGFGYGDFPVHSGLFDASKKTEHDALERMAVIPRHYEATGLDVNPRIVKKLEPYKERPVVAKLLEALAIIYEEEVVHVRKGDRWFRYLCKERGVEPEKSYRRILERHAIRSDGERLNVEARKAAGFSCSELLDLGASQCH